MKPWFKHYNIAHAKKVIIDLQKALGFHRGYAAYFLLVEHCHGIWDGNSEPTFNIPLKTLCDVVGMYKKNVILMLEIIQHRNNLKYNSNANEIQMKCDRNAIENTFQIHFKYISSLNSLGLK